MIASLPMYDLAEIAGHTDELWRCWSAALRRRGVDAPGLLNRPSGDLLQHWSRTDLLCSQSCGYPVAALLGERFDVAGTFSSPAGEQDRPGFYRSVIVARADDFRAESGLRSFEGCRVAANSMDSLSGWFSIGSALTEAGVRHLGPAIETGAHANSAVAVRDGEADLASIDAVTYALLIRHRPTAVDGLQVAGRGPLVRSLPIITALPEVVPALRDTAREALRDVSRETADALLIDGWVDADQEDYSSINALAAGALPLLGTTTSLHAMHRTVRRLPA